jgi:hypothetical protein
MGVKVWPIVVLGALPQDRKNENLKVLVEMGDNAKVVLEDTDGLEDSFNVDSNYDEYPAAA